ncbi:MAG: acyl-ACP--UDP-N-acetylglucosamine O-acyltransferase [Flavobacteriales bacterium]|nr:acyl-ACP--UDP-N-acetylglucosamine O-acyltransferase [Flavobacteriales bacterium]MCB9198718.1 acyl-ACP--UDP-N-acetylglucosamine O-acyltransferase [Flavobacteriales bacterium]
MTDSLPRFIHPDAKIGNNVVIEPFSTIYGDVEIGDNTWIGPNVTIFDGARIGSNCKIFPGAVISAVSQDLKYQGEYTTTHIGNNTTIRECVTIHKGTADRQKTVVGDNCLLMAYVHVAHDCIIGNNVIIANSTQLAGHITIGDWVVIEGMVGTQQFVHIGDHAFIAGMSSVRKNVPPYVKAAREPLSYVGVNSIGLRRRGFTDQQILNIEDTYRIIYVQNTNVTKALEIAEVELVDSEERNNIIDFIRNSQKGIMRGIN